MTEAKLSTDKALAYILAGNATVTLRSLKTGTRFTYQIVKAEKKVDSTYPDTWFVRLLTGPDNTSDYKYLGMVRDNKFRLTPKSSVPKEANSIVAFDWTLKKLAEHRESQNLEIWHVGRCGRCGRPLTSP